MEFAKCFYLKTGKFWHFRREIEQFYSSTLPLFLPNQETSFHRFQFLWDLISLNTKHANTFLLREVSQVGPRCFWNAQKWRSTEKLAKLTVYLSLEFPNLHCSWCPCWLNSMIFLRLCQTWLCKILTQTCILHYAIYIQLFWLFRPLTRVFSNINI